MQFKATVHKDGMQWGEYVTAGDTYTVTPPRNPRARFASYHFWNDAKQAGTFMSPMQFRRATKAGWVTIHTFANPNGVQVAA